MIAAGVALDAVVAALDGLYDLDTAVPDPAMSRHVPGVYDGAGVDWRSWVTPEFARRFNGLMVRGDDTVGRVFAAAFPSTEVLDQWLAAAAVGDLLITHHPVDVRNGHPDGIWAEGFVPIPSHLIDAITERRLSMYACHAPMDTSRTVGTASAIVEALGGTTEGHFFRYGQGFAGQVCRIPPISSEVLVERARELFGVDLVELRGARRPVIERVAVVGGVGDTVAEMTARNSSALRRTSPASFTYGSRASTAAPSTPRSCGTPRTRR